jgi:hypothetical protein
MFTREQYFQNLGFFAEPFASTNAQDEEFLDKYFISPPFFRSLVGSLTRPKSSIVIAPRGFGKTAQRRMLEKIAAENSNELVCIVYDDFPIEGISKATDVTFEKHLDRIIKSLLIALLSKISITDNAKEIYDEYEKKMLLTLIPMYLGNISSTELSQAIKTIKGIKGRLRDIWMSAGESINSIINSILISQGMGKVDLNSWTVKQSVKRETIFDDLEILEELFTKIGVESVFVLIDRVDETALTGNDSNSSYNLIKPLIKDLRLLERRTIVFKFFLWDKLKEHWENDIRRDRIEIYELNWSRDQIRQMINKRLQVFSDNKINSLDKILDCHSSLVDSIFVFSDNSPRDLINIMKAIFDTHINIIEDIGLIPAEENILQGIDKFCENKFPELIKSERQQKDLKKLKEATFTIPYLANEVFKLKESTVRNIIMPWTRGGIVIPSSNKIRIAKGKHAINVYTFTDVRVARMVCLNQGLKTFVQRNIIKCQCGKVNVFDKENKYGLKEWYCSNCQSKLKAEDSR